MTDNIEKLINSIKDNKVISIVYDNGKEDYYRRIHPYYLFSHRENAYLIALTDKHSDITTYKIDKIKNVEVTELTFSESKKSMMEYLRDKKHFTSRVESISITPNSETDQVVATLKKKTIKVSDNSTSYPRLSNVFNYYERSMKAQNLLDLTIKTTDEINYYVLDIRKIVELFNSVDKEVHLDDSFKHIFPEWDKLLKTQPDLTIYLGYPFVESNGSYIPVLYYAINYDIEKNAIKLISDSFDINGRFLDEDLELTDQEKYDLQQELRQKSLNQKQETHSFEKLNNYFRDIIEQYPLVNKGVIFLNSNTNFTKKLIQELKNFNSLEEVKIGIPLKSLVEAEDLSNRYSTYEHIYNIVDINESQEDVIRNSGRNLLLVQGPPGTGKTQTIINIIANEVIRGNKVLVSSVNNKAVDNIVEKLKDKGIFTGILRLGNHTYREAAKNEIIEILEKNYNQIPQHKIEDLRTQSARLSNQIDSLKKSLIEIMELENLENELTQALSNQENEFNQSDLRKDIIYRFITDTKADNIARCNQLILTYNKISVYCEKVDEARAKWYWRVLGKFNFNYDKYYIKRITERLLQTGVNIEDINNCIYIDEICLKVAQYISIVQYRIIALKLLEVKSQLKSLNRDDIYAKLTRDRKDKIDNDRALLNAIHNNLMYSKIQSKKDKILSHIQTNGIAASDKYLDVYSDMLDIYPVVATTSYAIANSVPENAMFEMSIIDEASQCNIASSLPVVKRSKRLIVVGDDKQLNPVVSIDEYLDNRNLEICNLIDEKDVYSFKNNSTFDIYNRIINKDSILLAEHYRCHPSIIEFANQEFYSRQLVTMTEDRQGDFCGIKLLDVKGKVNYSSQGRSRSANNNIEADYVIEFLMTNYHLFTDKSIGIITPFRSQKELINKKINSIIKNSLDDMQKEFLKKNVVVGTVHVFQGDECDIILFSSVLSNGATSGSVTWVNENSNLINVALTRAKEMFLLVGDIDYIKFHEGVLRNLVMYIESVGNKVEGLTIKNILNIYKLTFKDNYHKILDNPYIKSLLNKGEERFYAQLKNIINKDLKEYELGVKVRVADIISINQKRISAEEFRYSQNAHFDFVIFDKLNNTRPVLCIEYDGRYHREDKRSIMNDNMKNNLCKIFGMPLERVSSEVYLTENLLKNLLKRYCDKGKLTY